MANPTPTTFEQTVRGIWKILAKLLSEKAHGQLIISVRDGKVQLVEERRTHLGANLPEI